MSKFLVELYCPEMERASHHRPIREVRKLIEALHTDSVAHWSQIVNTKVHYGG